MTSNLESEEETVRNIVSAKRMSSPTKRPTIVQAPTEALLSPVVSQVIKDLDEISQSDPLLGDLINNKLSIKTDFENSTLDR